ncbi:hypothetical protein [Nocardia sp. NPDC057030]|uniref:hypothetical protein n=1 Tax=unclassified Nocardia TaxID=2637762 RepID=UPI0036398549
MGDQPAGGRFERGGGQRTTEIGFMHPDQPVACRCGVGAQPTKGQFVSCVEYHQDIRGGVPACEHVWMRAGKVEGGVCYLRDLYPR